MIARLVGWWVVLMAVYLMLISSVTRQEVVAGAVVAALASTLPAAAIRGFGPVAPPRRLHWRHLLALPLELVRDTLALVAALPDVRRHAGRTEERSLPAAGDPAAVRAYSVLALSATPGSYVMDVMVDDPDDPVGERRRGVVRVHRLGAGGGGATDRIVEG